MRYVEQKLFRQTLFVIVRKAIPVSSEEGKHVYRIVQCIINLLKRHPTLKMWKYRNEYLQSDSLCPAFLLQFDLFEVKLYVFYTSADIS